MPSFHLYYYWVLFLPLNCNSFFKGVLASRLIFLNTDPRMGFIKPKPVHVTILKYLIGSTMYYILFPLDKDLHDLAPDPTPAPYRLPCLIRYLLFDVELIPLQVWQAILHLFSMTFSPSVCYLSQKCLVIPSSPAIWKDCISDKLSGDVRAAGWLPCYE